MQHSEDLGRILIPVLNAARQSETIISIYKEDLSEFTRTIKEDTISVVKEVVKQEEGAVGSSTSASSEKKRPNAGGTTGRAGISTSSSGLSNFFNFMDSLKDEEEEEVLAKSRREKGVKKLQKDINTYTQPPADEEDFKEWKAGFNLEARTVEISQLLSANNKLRAIHNELLPKLTYSVFWERYYYRLEKLLKDEERREKILMRAELDNKLEDWGGWEDDDEGEGVEAATEEAKKDVEEEEREAEQDANDGATDETDAQGEEATAAETATEPAADEPAPVEDAAQHNAAEKSSTYAEEVAPGEEEEAAAPQGEEDKNAAEGREVVAGDLPKTEEDAAPEEEEEENDDDVLLDVEDSELVPTSPQVGEGDDDWDAWE